MKISVAMALVLVSLNSVAANKTLTKSVAPSRIVVAKDGVGLAQFSVVSRDFPDAQLLLAHKKLSSISWSTTHYPDNSNEEVDICYFQPGRANHEPCIRIRPNSSGTVTDFNSFNFNKHARIMIKHNVRGGKNYGAPAGMDTITINYSH